MRNAVYTECRKNLTSVSFLCGVISVLFLCLTSSVYTDARSKSFTALEMLLPSNRALASEISFKTAAISGLNNPYARLFLPIAAGMSFVPQICTERHSGYTRFQLIRSTRLRLALARCMSAMLLGGITVLLGFILYSLYAVCVFPSKVQNGSDMMTLSIPFWEIAAGKLCAGAVSAAMPLLLCTWLSDAYFILCLPVLWYFLLATAQSTLHTAGAQHILSFVQPLGAAELMMSYSFRHLLLVLLTPVTACSFFCFRHIHKRRGDCAD